METQGERTIPEHPSKNFYEYYRFKPGRDTPSDARNTLLVVATLIAAVTFQAGLNPPGGVWQDNSSNQEPGKAILGSNTSSYNIFLVANTLAFSSSTAAILWLVIGCPFQTEIWIALFSMSFTYGASIAAVHPEDTWDWRSMFIAYALPYLSRVILQCIRRYNKKTCLSSF